MGGAQRTGLWDLLSPAVLVAGPQGAERAAIKENRAGWRKLGVYLEPTTEEPEELRRSSRLTPVGVVRSVFTPYD